MARPIFVVRLRNTIPSSEYARFRDILYDSDLKDEYHILVMGNEIDKTQFEVLNADKIESQQWNDIVININEKISKWQTN